MPNEKRNPILKFFLDDTTLKRIASAVVADGNEVAGVEKGVEHGNIVPR